MMTPLNFLQAIGREEGVYAQGSRPQRNNNPGDIEYGAFAKAHGALRGDPRFAVFRDLEAGYAAMRALFQVPGEFAIDPATHEPKRDSHGRRQLVKGYAGSTVAEAVTRWAPPIENDTEAYIRNVCAWTGLTPDSIIDTHLGS